MQQEGNLLKQISRLFLYFSRYLTLDAKISLYSKLIIMVHEIMVINCVDTTRTHWLQIVLIFLVGGSADNSLSGICC
jgi:hypothetical protein